MRKYHGNYVIALTSTKYLFGSVMAWFRRAGVNPEHWISSDSHVWIKELPMKNMFKRFVKDDSGATAIEYGLIAAGISVAIIAVVNGLGTKLNEKFNDISTQLGGG
jgi:pilus assembly protein Flp/PilA